MRGLPRVVNWSVRHRVHHLAARDRCSSSARSAEPAAHPASSPDEDNSQTLSWNCRRARALDDTKRHHRRPGASAAHAGGEGRLHQSAAARRPIRARGGETARPRSRSPDAQARRATAPAAARGRASARRWSRCPDIRTFGLNERAARRDGHRHWCSAARTRSRRPRRAGARDAHDPGAPERSRRRRWTGRRSAVPPALAADLGVSTDAIAETVRVATIGDFDANLPKFNCRRPAGADPWCNCRRRARATASCSSACAGARRRRRGPSCSGGRRRRLSARARRRSTATTAARDVAIEATLPGMDAGRGGRGDPRAADGAEPAARREHEGERRRRGDGRGVRRASARPWAPAC